MNLSEHNMVTGLGRFAARACLCVLAALPLAAADEAQLLAQFRKTKPEVSQVHVMAEQPLLVAVTGPQGSRPTPSTWARGELLGVFARQGDQIVQISIVPNDDYPTAVWIDRQTPDSITFGLADPDFGARSDSLKIFFDPKTQFPKRIVRFAPVHIRRITLAAGVLTVVGSDGKQDFTARERNNVWRVTSSPAAATAPSTARAPAESILQIPPMPVSTFGEFEQARPEKARQAPQGAVIAETIGPYQKVATRIWVGKTFHESEDSVGVGDIGYYDEATQDWVFLHLPEMADWSASALLVEPDAIWTGLVRNSEGAGTSGGLLRYDRATHKVTTIALPDVIDKITQVGRTIYCGTSGGFAVVEMGRAKRYEFSPQLDGAYIVTPVL